MGFGTIGELITFPENVGANSHQDDQCGPENVQRQQFPALWNIPEFQRGFVWSTQEGSRSLPNRSGLDYPIGFFLLWDNESNGNSAKTVLGR